MVASVSEEAPGQDPKLLLDYGGKVHRALEETGRRLNQVLLGQTSLSFACAAVAVGLASPPPNYALIGLQMALSLPILLTGASLGVACLLMYQIGLVHHEVFLRSIIERIYSLLGFADESLENVLASPLEHPGLATVILSQTLTAGKPSIAYRATRTFVILLFLGFPIFSQVLVAYRLSVMGLLGWLAPVLLGFLLSVWHLLIYLRRQST